MRISIEFSALSRTHWYEYVSRFAFGGSVTALAGVIAKEFGPGIGGLFLAFPAIFPATATLLEKHQEEKKRRIGGHGTLRGRRAAALDAVGAAMGAIGLTAFAFVDWKLMAKKAEWIVLPLAIVAWFAVSVLIWRIWQMRPRQAHPDHRPGERQGQSD